MKWQDWPALRPEERTLPSEREAVLLALVRAGVLRVEEGRVIPDPNWPLVVSFAQQARPFGRAAAQRARPAGRLRLALGLLLLAVLVIVRGDRHGRD